MDPAGEKNRPFMYFDLVNACRQAGCPVCSLSAQAVRQFLESLFYEFVNDPGSREGLLKSQGFCAEHAGLLLRSRIADALGASIVYQNIIKRLLDDLPVSSSASTNARGRARFIAKVSGASNAPGRCPACKEKEAASERAIDGLSKALHDENLQLAFRGSDGLCFPHLSRLLERTASPEDLKFLLDLTRLKLEGLQAEMGELIRKNDYHYQSEGITEREGQAWRKAMRMISGAEIDEREKG
jgi:hypothetical protein